MLVYQRVRTFEFQLFHHASPQQYAPTALPMAHRPSFNLFDSVDFPSFKRTREGRQKKWDLVLCSRDFDET